MGFDNIMLQNLACQFWFLFIVTRYEFEHCANFIKFPQNERTRCVQLYHIDLWWFEYIETLLNNMILNTAVYKTGLDGQVTEYVQILWKHSQFPQYITQKYLEHLEKRGILTVSKLIPKHKLKMATQREKTHQ